MAKGSTTKLKEHTCILCKETFISLANAHPKWCKVCSLIVQKEQKDVYYIKNKNKCIKQAKVSQNKYIRNNGICRAALIRSGLSPAKYRKMRLIGCIVCGFNEVNDIHHIIPKDNKSIVLLCPNHHAMVHRIKFDISAYFERRKGEKREKLI